MTWLKILALINLMVNNGWITSIDLETNDGLFPIQKVLADYDKLPMHCKVCHSWKHIVKDSTEIQKRMAKGGRRPAHTSHKPTPDKGKNISLDEDGFQ